MDNQLLTYWADCLKIFRDNLTETAYNAWFAPLSPLSCENQVLVLQVPSQYCVDYIEENYIDLLSKTLVRVFGRGIKLEYRVVIDSETGSGTVIPSDTMGQNVPSFPSFTARQYTFEPQRQEMQPFNSQLNSGLNFGAFVEGQSNHMAYTAGLSIAQNPGKTAFNPMFVYGGSGVGKTHLANAIGNRVKQLYPEKRVLYVAANTFQMQYQTAVIDNKVNDFLMFYQSIDVLIVDDIQYFADKKGTQNTFFFIFNHLQQTGKQLILTSDKAPLELQGLEQRLLSRFKWGLSVEITRPDFELRRGILKNKIYRDGLEIGDDVVDFIADNVVENVRDLEGVLVSLMAYSTFSLTPIDLQLARDVVGRLVELKPKEISLTEIIDNVSDYYGVSAKEIASKSRRREVANARQVAMYLAKQLTNKSLKEIGRAIGNRDHATVLHSVKIVADTLEYDTVFRRSLTELENRLRK